MQVLWGRQECAGRSLDLYDPRPENAIVERMAWARLPVGHALQECCSNLANMYRALGMICGTIIVYFAASTQLDSLQFCGLRLFSQVCAELGLPPRKAYRLCFTALGLGM